jgi:hypothetical protein
VSTCDGQWPGNSLAAVGLAAQGRPGKTVALFGSAQIVEQSIVDIVQIEAYCYFKAELVVQVEAL